MSWMTFKDLKGCIVTPCNQAGDSWGQLEVIKDVHKKGFMMLT